MCMRAQQRVAFGKHAGRPTAWCSERVAEIRIADRAGPPPHHEGGVADGHRRQRRPRRSRSRRSRSSRLASRPTVIDRAIQLFGGAGVSDDWPLASMYTHARTLHLVDGPDEVHLPADRPPRARAASARRSSDVKVRGRRYGRLGVREPSVDWTATVSGRSSTRSNGAASIRCGCRSASRAPPPIRCSASRSPPAAYEPHQTRHERAGAARPQPGAARQGMGDASTVLSGGRALPAFGLGDRASRRAAGVRCRPRATEPRSSTRRSR